MLFHAHRRHRQRLVDDGEILRFGLAGLVLVDIPTTAALLPGNAQSAALTLALAAPGAGLIVAAARGSLRIRAIGLLGAVYAPLLAALLARPFLAQADLVGLLNQVADLLIGFVGLPLAVLISAASVNTPATPAATA